MNKSFIDDSNCTSIYEPIYNRKEILSHTGKSHRGIKEIRQEDFDFAAEVQYAFEQAYIKMIKYYQRRLIKRKLS